MAPLSAAGGRCRGSDELAGTSWVWTETLMSDDSKTTPAQADAFQLAFGADGSVSTTTDCNTNAGSYTVDGNQIKLDFQISTMMACPNDAQEASYIKDLLGVQSYLICRRQPGTGVPDGLRDDDVCAGPVRMNS